MNEEAREILKNFGEDNKREILIISLNCDNEENQEWDGFVATIKKYIKQQNDTVKEKITHLFKKLKVSFAKNIEEANKENKELFAELKEDNLEFKANFK